MNTRMGTAVVTGASSGIGKVYADRLAQMGYDLILVARRAERLETLGADLRGRYGISATTLVADLSKAADLERVAKTIGSDTSVTMLVNNAGTLATGTLTDSAEHDLSAVISLNVMAPTQLTVAVLSGFKSRNRGVIVNLGSAVGFDGHAGSAVYGGTKAYIHNFTRSLQAELAGTAVVAQLLSPALTVSEIWDNQKKSLSDFDPAIVMTTENCVDAALQGLKMGEKITLPSVHDAELITDYEAAGAALFAGTQRTGKPAPRYGLGADKQDSAATASKS